MFPDTLTVTSEAFARISQEQDLPDILLPRCYEAWRYCVEVKGGITITAEFLEERIATLSNGDHPETHRLAQMYGLDHVARLILWVRQAWSACLC